jgi:hypothetical protein
MEAGMTEGSHAREDMLQQVRQAIANAESRTRELRRENSRLIILGLITGALGTIMAAFAAAKGPVTGQGPHAWRVTCGIVATLTACATLFPGLNQQLSIPDRLAKANICVGRLRGLEIGLTVTQRDPTEVAGEYQEVCSAYHEFVF